MTYFNKLILKVRKLRAMEDKINSLLLKKALKIHRGRIYPWGSGWVVGGHHNCKFFEIRVWVSYSSPSKYVMGAS